MVILCKQIKMSRFDKKYEVSGFLYSVCRNLWINKVKKEKRIIPLPDHLEGYENYDFTNDIITDQKSKVLKEVIVRLGEKCFKLLQLSIYNNLSGNEICDMMGFTSVNAVKTQKYKCKQKLLEILELNPVYKEVIE
jgi:RNA polymerase sigma factor (sigma-70 family)